MTPLPAQKALDTFFLEARCKVLDVAAILDRINRGEVTHLHDPRMEQIRRAIGELLKPDAGRAERIQQIFSLEYDANWPIPQPK